jgi:transketolase
MPDVEPIEKLAKLIRYYILTSTTEAGSGHPTSSLSAVELMTALVFGGVFRSDPSNPRHPNNDRLIFSKGHASPLLYALWAAAGKVSKEELATLRRFGSPLEGHPTLAFPYTEAATGSLGQGLSVGVGMALNAKYIDKLPYRTFVLLGDSEMAEGSQWEAIQSAAHYRLNNLVAVLDVNRLGQRGETMYGHDTEAYKKRVAAFGWKTFTVDGHVLPEVLAAYRRAVRSKDRPVMIIAKTVKGKGVSFIEGKNGWHGKALNRDECEQALQELGDVDLSLRGVMSPPRKVSPEAATPREVDGPLYAEGKAVATRRAYGNALARIYPKYPAIVALDAEVSNSTYAEIFAKQFPERYFEMFVAEQNMVGAALGFSRRGKIPFVSSFAAFLTRAYDQIRMSRYSDANVKYVGSHAGVSIGEDGSSQMGLEDLAMFRAILDSVVFYPSDAMSAERLVEEAARHEGMVYIRTTRKDTPILYTPSEEFHIGGSKVLKRSSEDVATLVSAGATLFEALAAYDDLLKEGIRVRVIDLYSVKPVDEETLTGAGRETKAVITIEDHFAEGGIGDAVRSALSASAVPVYSLAVRKMPRSGKPEELLDYEEISKDAIIRKVKEAL